MSVSPAEAQLRQRLAELARSHRFSVAREIAATIAHEIRSLVVLERECDACAKFRDLSVLHLHVHLGDFGHT